MGNEIFNYNFDDFVKNIETIKSYFQGVIVSFSMFELKQQIEFKKRIRTKIYSFDVEVWKCDRLLEFIYNDIDIETFKKIF